MKIGSKTIFYNHELRKMRAEKGTTQAKLADAVGVSVAIISELELLRRPYVDADKLRSLLFSICDYFCCDIEEIFPKDFVQYLEHGGNRCFENPVIFIHDVRINELPGDDPAFLLPDVAKQYEDKNMAEIVDDVLNRLPERETEIIKYRYGIGENENHTYEQTAKRFGVSRARIIQIEAQGLSRIRHPKNSRHLRVFMEG